MTQQQKPGQSQHPQQQAGQQNKSSEQQRAGQQSGGQQHGDQQKSGQQQADHQRAGQQKNEGEGNRTAARAYNADQHRFAEDKGKVDKAAHAAERAVDGPEGASLREAEKAGRKHARE